MGASNVGHRNRSPQRSSVPGMSKLSAENFVGPLLLLVFVSIALNVAVLDHTQRRMPTTDLVQAGSLLTVDARQRQLSSIQQSPESRAGLSDARTLQNTAELRWNDSSLPNLVAESETSRPPQPGQHTPERAVVNFEATTRVTDGKESSQTMPENEGRGIREHPNDRPDSIPVLETATSAPQLAGPEVSDPGSVLHSGNLAIGMAHGVDETNIAVFAASLRSVSNCKIVLFVNSPSEQVVRLFDRYGVTAVQFELNQLPPQVRSYQTDSYRWYQFQKYLADKSSQYDKILIADVDDTAFQSDPFAIQQMDGVYLGSNDDKWIDKGRGLALLQLCYGMALASELGKKQVANNGVLVGSPAALLNYLNQLTEKMKTPEFATCQKKGSDQAAHHALQHGSTIHDLRVMNQQNGQIGHVGAGKMKTDRNGTLVNRLGAAVSVVHEYDVDSKLASRLFRKFVDKDLRFGKKGRGKCRAFWVQSNVLPYDSSAAHVHLPPEDALSLDRCCEMCSERAVSGCQGFIYEHDKARCIFKGALATKPQRSSQMVFPGATAGLRAI